jgi:hypothetical protein
MLGLSKRLGWSGVAGALFVLSSVALPTLAVTGQAHAADHQVNQLEMKARESFAAGRYDEALQTFAKLYAETLHPVYLRNIGRCHQKMREPQKAIDAFQDYLAKTKTGKEKIGADERAEIEGYIKDMTALRDEQARAAVAPTPPAPVTPLPGTNAAQPLPAAPPPVEPSANPPAATLTATAPPPAQDEHHPIYTRWWFWTIIGVAVVGGVVGAVALSGGTTKPSCTAPGGCM